MKPDADSLFLILFFSQLVSFFTCLLLIIVYRFAPAVNVTQVEYFFLKISEENLFG
jgi:hypothetical protein